MNESDLLNRRGIFYLTTEIWNKEFNNLTEVFREIKLTVLTAEHDWDRNNMRVIGVSPLFKEVKEGDKIPAYDITVKRTKSKKTCPYCLSELNEDKKWEVEIRS